MFLTTTLNLKSSKKTLDIFTLLFDEQKVDPVLRGCQDVLTSSHPELVYKMRKVFSGQIGHTDDAQIVYLDIN